MRNMAAMNDRTALAQVLLDYGANTKLRAGSMHGGVMPYEMAKGELRLLLAEEEDALRKHVLAYLEENAAEAGADDGSIWELRRSSDHHPTQNFTPHLFRRVQGPAKAIFASNIEKMFEDDVSEIINMPARPQLGISSLTGSRETTHTSKG